MKERKMEVGCIAVKRYNCLCDKNDVEHWKEWFVAVQKPMDCILAAALIMAGVLAGVCLLILHAQVENGTLNVTYTYGKFQEELFLVQLGIVMSMFLVISGGNRVILRKLPRPKLERCLEIRFYKDSFSIFYYYKKDKSIEYIDNFTYKMLEFIRLDHDILLINGRKFQLGNSEIDSIMTETEKCKYRRFHGYLQGIYRFPYDTDVKKMTEQICMYKEKSN